jgi:hypothetical protein
MTRHASLVATREEIELITTFVYPPIPIRSMDWSAIDGNTYDADYDYEAGCYVSHSPHGTGPTELAAINDLFDQLEERREIEEAWGEWEEIQEAGDGLDSWDDGSGLGLPPESR